MALFMTATILPFHAAHGGTFTADDISALESGEKIIICTVNGMKLVSVDDLSDTEENPSLGLTCPLSILSHLQLDLPTTHANTLWRLLDDGERILLDATSINNAPIRYIRYDSRAPPALRA